MLPLRRTFARVVVVVLVVTACSLSLALSSSSSRADTKPPATGTAAEVRADTFCNPIDVLVADPFIYREGDTYYLYGTASGEGLYVWTSPDLVHWHLRGHAYERSAETWGREHFWAPELFKHDGKYYLHFTALGPNDRRRVVLAKGESPLGPFTEMKAPWFDVDWTVIDGHVYRDGDGTLYLYAVEIGRPGSTSFEIRVRKLDPKTLEPGPDLGLCLKPTESWEGGHVNEGPFVLKHGDTYLLTFSANGFEDPNYCVGEATAPHPLGPWTKRTDAPILRRREGVSGPGHHCFVDSPDGKELFIAYHTHQQARQPSGARQLAIDRARVVDGAGGVPSIEVDGPTTGPQPLPGGAAGLARGQADEFDADSLDRGRWVVFNEHGPNWSMTGGRLVVETMDGDVHEGRSDLRNLFLQYAPLGDFDVTTRVAVKPEQDYEQAGLYLWQDHNHFVKLAVVYAGGVRVEVADEVDGRYVSGGREFAVGPETWLRIKKRGNRHEFLVSPDGNEWTSFGTRSVTLRDLRVGLGATAPVSERSIPAAFDFVRFEPVNGTR
jgi:beta-xylosidase